MNSLRHIDEFRSVLDTYHLSETAQQTLTGTNLVLLVGVTSSGRNTIIEKLLKTGDYYHIVSDTTRSLRTKDGMPIEKNGREYWFRTEEEVLADLRKGEYIEAAIIHNQQVSGCNIRELAAADQNQKIAIKDIEPGGAHTIHAYKPDTTIIFVIPPTFEEWMARLHSRSDLPEDEILRRLESACQEIVMVLDRDYYTFIVNHDLDESVGDVHEIAKLGHHDEQKERAARMTAEQLYRDTQAFLRTKTNE